MCYNLLWAIDGTAGLHFLLSSLWLSFAWINDNDCSMSCVVVNECFYFSAHLQVLQPSKLAVRSMAYGYSRARKKQLPVNTVSICQ